MSPFDTAHETSYWCSIVTMALSSVVSEIFNVEQCRDLEIRVTGHSRSSKVVPFDSFLSVFYSNFLHKMHRFWDIRLVSIQWSWNPRWGPLKVIRTDMDQSAACDFLLTFHSNHGPISHRYRDKRRLSSKIANFSHPPPCILRPRWRNLVSALGVKN